MRRAFLLFTMAGAMLLACAALALAQQQPKQQTQNEEGSPKIEYVEGEILVKFKKSVSAQSQTDAHEEKGGKVKKTIPKIDVDVVEVPEGEEDEKVAEYEADSNVEYAEKNGTLYASDTQESTGAKKPTKAKKVKSAKEATNTSNDDPKADALPNDPQVGQQYQYNNTGQTGGTADADIDAKEAWDTSLGSSSVNIAILDTGIDQSHEDLVSKIVLQKDFTNSSSGVEDIQGHGTHVAGSAAAISNNSKGVGGTCQNCSLINGKVLDDTGSGTFEGVASGIIWAADNGAKVINMSLGAQFSTGSQPPQVIVDAVNHAVDTKKVVVAAAAGNEGSNNGQLPYYPSNIEKIISVASTNHNDAKSSFSNYGSPVDVAAPGDNILSTAPDHNNNIWGSGVKYGTISGTSMATPHVAGLAGLVWSTNQCTTSDNVCVRQKIEDNADQISGTGNFWAKGRINANEALGGGTDPGTPTIVSTTPTENATKVVRNTPVTATFSEAMAPNTLTSSTVALVKVGFRGKTTPVTATLTVSSDSKTVTLDPSTNLGAFATYRATIKGGSSGAKDLEGNPLAADKVWSFKTGFK